MKKAITKALSVLLVVTILATSLPFSTLAAEENAQNNQTISTDMGDMSITATNSFGEMLTESLSEQTNEQNAGYYISDVEYEGYCALVSFVTQQDCTIRVAVYEEDTGRMVTTASADVLATDTEAIVEFEDELPDYFVLKAFMLDEKVAPLCKAYTCNEMTKMYEDFMATTTEDFPEDKVINLDEDETNNFLVMSDDTTTVTTDDKTNVLLSYDSENGIYTFGNIDEQITSLKKDDIFYFDNGNIEELTFIKVGAIDIDGTTAEITEAETSIEEVFDIVKIDNDMSSGDFVIDEDEELEEGVTYIGCEEVEEPNDEVSTFAFESEKDVTFKHSYTLDKEWEPKEPKKIGKQTSLTGSIKIEGSVGFSITGTFKYYISKKFSEVEFTLTPSVSIDVSIEGVGRLEVKLKALDYSPCIGVYVGISPKFVVEASVKASFNATLKFTLGIGYNTNDGFVNKSEKPSFKPKFKIEGSVFIGVDLAPRAYVASEKVAKVELGSEIGAKLTATISTDKDDNHLCDSCLDGDIDLVGELTGKLVFGEKTKFEKSLNINFLNIKIDIASFYYSFTFDVFGWGECLYKNEICIANLECIDYGWYTENEGDSCLFNLSKDGLFNDKNEHGYYRNGNIGLDGTEYNNGFEAWLARWNYENEISWVYATYNLRGKFSYLTCSTDLIDSYNTTNFDTTVYFYNNDILLYSVNLTDENYKHNFVVNVASVNELTIKVKDNVAVSGGTSFALYDMFLTNENINLDDTDMSGENLGICGDNLIWTLDESTGILTISGTGDMYDGSPWGDYTDKIKEIIINNGVTSIGNYAFEDCINLKSVTIPSSVVEIGYSAFYNCENLNNVYYSGSENQWNKMVIGDYNDPLFDATIHYNSTGITYSLRLKQPKMMSFTMSKSSDLTVYNATASNAISGNEYIIVVLNDTADINGFTNNDLLYIDQKTAETDGNITFNYVPKSDEECIVYIIGVFSGSDSVKQEQVIPVNSNEPNIPEEPEYNYTFIIQIPSRTTIRHKDGIKLHANIEGSAPDGSYVVWTASNGNFKTEEINGGDSLKIVSDKNGYTTFTATLHSADGEVLAIDTIEMQSKAGFFDKIGSFFRSLFGGTKIYEN